MADYRNYSTDHTVKRCGICHRDKPVIDFRMRASSRGSYRSRNCRVCENCEVDEYRRCTKAGAVAEIFRRCRRYSRQRNQPFDLTKDWIRAELDQQQWCCCLTGLPFNWQKIYRPARSHVLPERTGYRWDSLSTDRVRAGGSYTKDNVRFVLNIVNIFRMDGGDARMYAVATALLQHREQIAATVADAVLPDPGLDWPPV